MFSTISSYIWGGEETSEVPAPTSVGSEAPPLTSEVVIRPQKQPPKTARRAPPTSVRDQSPQTGEDWVLIGTDPAGPGNLSGDALHPLPPVSETSSVNGDQTVDGEVISNNATRVPASSPPAPRTDNNTIGIQQQTQKCLKQAQLTKQRNTSKALSSKALKRGNKAVTMTRGKKENVKHFNLPIKSAGFNKNLKQC